MKLGFFKKEGTNFFPGAFLPLRGGGAISVASSSCREDEIYSSTDDVYCCWTLS
jgi:hypothetical protein